MKEELVEEIKTTNEENENENEDNNEKNIFKNKKTIVFIIII